MNTNRIMPRAGRGVVAGAALIASVLLALADVAAADPATPEQVQERQRKMVAQELSKLNADMLTLLFNHIGITPSVDFNNCMCPGGFHAYAGADAGGPCRRIGPLGGTSWTGYDMNTLLGCAASVPLADGSNLLDKVAQAAKPSRASTTPTADTTGAKLRKQVITLEQACLPVGDRIYAILDEYDKQYAGYERAVKAFGHPTWTSGTPPARPASEPLVDEIYAALQAAPDPCEQAAEVNLIAERSSVRSTTGMAVDIAAVWVVPGADDVLVMIARHPVLDLLSNAKNLVKSMEIWRDQQQVEVYSGAMQEARKVIRSNRPITQGGYDSISGSYDDESQLLREKVAQAQVALDAGLSEIDKMARDNRPVSGAPGAQHIQFENSIRMEENHAFGVYDEVVRDVSLRLNQIAFTKAALEKHLAPRIGLSCEQFIASNCHE